MKTYFAGIRRWCAVLAWAVPLLNAGTVLSLALGARYWALIPWILAAIAAVSFPGLRGGASPAPGKEAPWLKLLPLPGMIALYVWLIRQPELAAFYQRLLSGEALRHWLIAVAVALLTAASIYRRRLAVQRLTDDDIYRFYEAGAGVLKQ
jgi:dolichyl-phosphate-mannose--protein O-mannosyl transferase